MRTLPIVQGRGNTPDEIIIVGKGIRPRQHILLTLCLGLHKAHLADWEPVVLSATTQSYKKVDRCYMSFIDNIVTATRPSNAETLFPLMNLRHKESCSGEKQQTKTIPQYAQVKNMSIAYICVIHQLLIHYRKFTQAILFPLHCNHRCATENEAKRLRI